MKRWFWLTLSYFCCMLLVAGGVMAAAPDEQAPAQEAAESGAGEGTFLTLKVPIFSPRFSQIPVAVVNNEPILLKEFVDSLATTHKGRTEAHSGSRRDFSRALQRLINTKLIVLEARTMGMDDRAETKYLLDVFSKSTLRQMLQERLTKDVKADEAEVERLYRESTRECKLRSLMFQSEEDARKLVAAVAAGGDFGELSAKAVAEGRARASKEAEYIKTADLMPEVKQVVSIMKPGDLSKPIPIKPGFVVFKLDDVRITESPEARERAHREVLAKARGAALVEDNEALSKKYLKFNMKLIKSLTFEPGKMEALLKDKRALVQVKGESPITVGDLADAIEGKLYHGSGASTEAKITKRKMDTLEVLIAKRVLLAEAKKQGIERTDEYKQSVRDYEESLLFGMFVEMAVKPGVKLKHEEVQTYYEKHRDEFLASGRVKIEGLAFTQKSDAQKAFDNIARGTDLRWLRENAPGQAGGNAPGVLSFGEGFTEMDSLPDAVRAALSGARPGETRLVDGAGGYVYVLVVHDVRSPEPRPLEEVKNIIERKVFDEKIESAIDVWAAKLRPSYDVKVYLRENGQEAAHDPKSAK